jgi:hypothetical protein
MAASLQFFATNNQYAYPQSGVQYSVGYPAFGVAGIPGPVGRYFAQRVEPNPTDLGAFDTAQEAIAACQADYNALPPPSS